MRSTDRSRLPKASVGSPAQKARPSGSSTPKVSTGIRVLIVDDYPMLRAGLRMLIDAQAEMRVVGEASDAHEAVAQARKTKPDVVLMDLTIPGTDEVDPIRETLRICPKARVLVLTMHDDPAHARAALSAGASGYLVKTAGTLELMSAIRAVRGGRTFVDVDLAESVAMVRRRPPRDGARSTRPLLSPREREVLELIVRGNTNKEIAGTLRVSVKTVETHRSRLAAKLNLKGRADFMRYALASGLLSTGKRPVD